MAYIGGAAPARWGPLGYFGPLTPLTGPVKTPLHTKVGGGGGGGVEEGPWVSCRLRRRRWPCCCHSVLIPPTGAD